MATLADAEGNYVFRNLPDGPLTLEVIRPGCADASTSVSLSAERETIQDIALAADTVAGNLLRNASLDSRWLDPDNPDGWYPQHVKGEHYWESDLVPLRAGQEYLLQVRWQGAAGKAVVRLLPGGGVNVSGTDQPPLIAGETERTISVPEGISCADHDLWQGFAGHGRGARLALARTLERVDPSSRSVHPPAQRPSTGCALAGRAPDSRGRSAAQRVAGSRKGG